MITDKSEILKPEIEQFVKITGLDSHLTYSDLNTSNFFLYIIPKEIKKNFQNVTNRNPQDHHLLIIPKPENIIIPNKCGKITFNWENSFPKFQLYKLNKIFDESGEFHLETQLLKSYTGKLVRPYNLETKNLYAIKLNRIECVQLEDKQTNKTLEGLI